MTEIIYFVFYIPNCEERYILYSSKDRKKCEEYINNYSDNWRKHYMVIFSIPLEEELDFL